MTGWVIAGKPNGALPEVGKIYDVRHSRKGNFTLEVTGVDGEWVTGRIVRGVAGAMMRYNVREAGDEITVRASMTYLIELRGAP